MPALLVIALFLRDDKTDRRPDPHVRARRDFRGARRRPAVDLDGGAGAEEIIRVGAGDRHGWDVAGGDDLHVRGRRRASGADADGRLIENEKAPDAVGVEDDAIGGGLFHKRPYIPW